MCHGTWSPHQISAFYNRLTPSWHVHCNQLTQCSTGISRYKILDCVMKIVNYYNFYRPQTKFRKGNVFTGVCDSVHGGVCLVLGGVWSWEGVWSVGCVWSRGCLVPWGSGPVGCGSRGCLVETPWMATAAGGTHPTGMNSCFTFYCQL